uniref:Carboxylic ester hydrolase n=1 Tax=Biomphalaria glabrata TaxID=6526 RepID=A0A182Z9A3_BIOGL
MKTVSRAKDIIWQKKPFTINPTEQGNRKMHFGNSLWIGILGFLSTEDDASPGNFGLWDQILAIKWVKRNIAAFGGDPNDITIAGESAGGASVSILSISPVSKNLFTKVYSHSGFATSLFADYKNPMSDVITLSKKLGCYQSSSSSQDIIECLRNKPAASLIAELDLYKTSYVPRVDGELLPKLPMNLLTTQLEKLHRGSTQELSSFCLLDLLYIRLRKDNLQKPFLIGLKTY